MKRTFHLGFSEHAKIGKKSCKLAKKNRLFEEKIDTISIGEVSWQQEHTSKFIACDIIVCVQVSWQQLQINKTKV